MVKGTGRGGAEAWEGWAFRGSAGGGGGGQGRGCWELHRFLSGPSPTSVGLGLVT